MSSDFHSGAITKSGVAKDFLDTSFQKYHAQSLKRGSFVEIMSLYNSRHWQDTTHGALERCLNGFATKCYKQKNTSIWKYDPIYIQIKNYIEFQR